MNGDGGYTRLRMHPMLLNCMQTWFRWQSLCYMDFVRIKRGENIKIRSPQGRVIIPSRRCLREALWRLWHLWNRRTGSIDEALSAEGRSLETPWVQRQDLGSATDLNTPRHKQKAWVLHIKSDKPFPETLIRQKTKSCFIGWWKIQNGFIIVPDKTPKIKEIVLSKSTHQEWSDGCSWGR